MERNRANSYRPKNAGKGGSRAQQGLGLEANSGPAGSSLHQSPGWRTTNFNPVTTQCLPSAARVFSTKCALRLFRDLLTLQNVKATCLFSMARALIKLFQNKEIFFSPQRQGRESDRIGEIMTAPAVLPHADNDVLWERKVMRWEIQVLSKSGRAENTAKQHTSVPGFSLGFASDPAPC